MSTEESTPNQRCAVCHNTESRFICSDRGFDLKECLQCGLGYVSPLPSPEQLAAIYSDPTYFLGGGEFGYKHGYEVCADEMTGPYESRLNYIEHIGKVGTIVDVGSATGMFVRIAKRHGWRPIAIEFSEFSRAKLQELEIEAVPTLEDLKLPPGSVQAITYWEVLEHLIDFREALTVGARLLADDGIMAISVPNYANMRIQQVPKNWSHFRPPEHLWYWDQKSMSLLLSQHGLEVVHCEGQTFMENEAIDTPAAKVRQPLNALAKAILPPPLVTLVRDTIYRPILKRSFAKVAETHGDLALHCTLIVYARKLRPVV